MATNRKNYLPEVDIPNASGLSEFIAQLALEMSTSATNHLIANCPKKIRKYLEIHYNHLYPVANQSRPSPRDGWELLNFIFKDDKKNKKPLNFMEDRLNKKVKYYPNAKNIKSNTAHFIYLCWIILKEFELCIEDKQIHDPPNVPIRVKLFSLLPVNGDFVISHDDQWIFCECSFFHQ